MQEQVILDAVWLITSWPSLPWWLEEKLTRRVFWIPGDNPICAVPTFLHFDPSSDPIDVLLKSGPEFGHEQVRAACSDPNSMETPLLQHSARSTVPAVHSDVRFGYQLALHHFLSGRAQVVRCLHSLSMYGLRP